MTQRFPNAKDVKIEFLESRSKYYVETVNLARRFKTYKECVESEKKWHSVVISSSSYDELKRILSLVKSWSGTRLFINENEVDYKDLSLGFDCFNRYGSTKGCKGQDDLFECRRIGIWELRTCGGPEFQQGGEVQSPNFGYYDSNSSEWVVNKAALREEIAKQTKSVFVRDCPLFDEKRIVSQFENYIATIPDRINPVKHPEWAFEDGENELWIWRRGLWRDQSGMERKKKPPSNVQAATRFAPELFNDKDARVVPANQMANRKKAKRVVKNGCAITVFMMMLVSMVAILIVFAL